MPPIAIVSAMHEELRALLPLLQQPVRHQLAGREFHEGEIHGRPVVLVLSGIGKVAAATTAALLVQRFDAAPLVFTGVAGGLGAGVSVGDVVVAHQLIQHDMDASPLFPRFEVPLTGRSRFDVDAPLADALAASVQRRLQDAGRWAGATGLASLLGARAPAELGKHGVNDAAVGETASGPQRGRGERRPTLHRGLVASGDRFISSQSESAALRAALPDVLAVEMEGAALAQVCIDFGRPFAVLRTISDRADDTAHIDFTRFIDEVASVYTRVIVADWLAGAASA
ncbi:MAG: S-adenosylhomocysteine nucleosidase [Methylibium sp. NZG]|nr:MAG: S-adenosylhomocysteine nucleosidase [Methylibium sp. NZG]